MSEIKNYYYYYYYLPEKVVLTSDAPVMGCVQTKSVSSFVCLVLSTLAHTSLLISGGAIPPNQI